MTELQRQARLFDLTEPDPAKKGLNIIPLIGEEEEPTVNIKLNAMPLGKMVEFITEMVGWTFDVRSDAVVIQKTGGTFKGRPLETEFYQMNPGTVQRLTGSSGGGAADADPLHLLVAEVMGVVMKVLRFEPFLKTQAFHSSMLKAINLHLMAFQMIITHERRYLDLIERILIQA
jgi:hypothetical protein